MGIGARGQVLFVMAALLAGGAMFACVGDDPDPVTPAPDAGNTSGGTGTPDAEAPSGSLELAVAAPSVTILPTKTATLAVTIERKGGFRGPVKITTAGVPGGVEAPSANVAADGTTATLTFVAGSTPTVGVAAFEVIAEALDGSVGAKATVEIVVRGAPGSIDTSFASTGIALDFPLLPADGVFLEDGSMIVGGSAKEGTSINADYAAVRLLPDGTRDMTFGPSEGVFTAKLGKPTVGEQAVRKLAIDANQVVSMIGHAAGDGGTTRFGIVRFGKNGMLDQGLALGGIGPRTGAAYGAENFGDSTFLMGFENAEVGGYAAVAKVGPTGFDPAFGDGGAFTDTHFLSGPSGILQPDGKILVAGSGGSPGSGSHGLVLRFHPDGRPDVEFGSKGAFMFDTANNADGATALVILPGGRILVVGYYANPSRPYVNVLTPEGTVYGAFNAAPIPSVGTAGINARRAALQSDGAIIITGTANRDAKQLAFITRMFPTGELDPKFNGGEPLLVEPPGLPDMFYTFHNIRIDRHDRLVIFAQRAVLRYWL